MKLKIKDLFIGLEFKIEQEVDLPQELLLKRISEELRKLDYEIIKQSADVIRFEDGWNHVHNTYIGYHWHRIDKGSFEVLKANGQQNLKFLFSVSIYGVILAVLAIFGMGWATGYEVFPFALIFLVLSTVRGMGIKNKMYEIFNAVTQPEVNN